MLELMQDQSASDTVMTQARNFTRLIRYLQESIKQVRDFSSLLSMNGTYPTHYLLPAFFPNQKYGNAHLLLVNLDITGRASF